MIKVVDKNIVYALEDIIVQQVNCQGKMGRGLALQLSNEYPDIVTDYIETIQKFKSSSRCNENEFYRTLLGTVSVTKCKSKFITSIFGQAFYGSSGKFTDYGALEKGLLEVRSLANEKNLTIAIPFKIGCDRGGGNWSIVSGMLLDVFSEMDITLYRYNDRR